MPSKFLTLSELNDHDPMILSIFAIEAIFMALSLVLAGITMRALIKTALLHYNLRVLLCLCDVQYLLLMTSRVSLVICQLKEATGFWLFDLADFVRTQCLGAMSLIPLILMCERILATNYSRDYESVRRPWISIVLGIFYFVIPVIQTFAFSKGFIGIPSYAVICVFFCLTGLVLFYVELFLNKRMLKLCEETEKYSLSYKYQLSETVRTMELFRRIAFFTTIGLAISAFLFTFISFYKEGDFVDCLFSIFYVGLPVSSTVVQVILLEELNAFPYCITHACVRFRIRKQSRINIEKVDGEAYFSKLASAWS